MRVFHLLALALVWGCFAPASAAPRVPEQVLFQSLDGKTRLVGYLFAAQGGRSGRVPAVVMLHGRAGPYSTAAHGVFDATTLSRRHASWGAFWAEQGYIALLVDSFGPRGFPEGFAAHSYQDRPEAVNEVSVRPLDAYGALLYLRQRADIDPKNIALQGWSNGGSATIASLSDGIFAETSLAQAKLTPESGFLGGLAFYPACGLHGKFADSYRPYAPLRLFSGDADEEVSTEGCAALASASAAKGGDVAIRIYRGATHGFDDPGLKRQKLPANAEATDDAILRARDFVKALFDGGRAR